jgi:hypothetical protein
MSIVVFAGPTIKAAEIRARLDCTVLPPAGVGDVLRAARRSPRAIALIDGVFERSLPVWHKEVLWALSQGVHVFGAGSMGALRAAELHAFGMVGVGRIFEAYRDGELEADDEVAVLHGPAEVGHAVVTEALVNVRATLDHARAERVLSPPEADELLDAARSVHYRERTWEMLLDRLARPTSAARLRSWLPRGRVDRKLADALELLDRLAAFVAEDPPPLRATFPFAWTDAWDALHGAVGQGHADEDVLDELRLQVDRLPTIREAALLRLLARQEAERAGVDLRGAVLRDARERLRARLGLWRRADLERWLHAAELDVGGFEALVEDEALREWLGARAGGALAPAMLAELRARGDYPALAQRAREKALALAAAGLDGVAAAQADVDTAPLLSRLGERSAGDPSASGGDLALRLGFADRTALERAVLREQLFVRMIAVKDGGPMQAPPEAQPAGSDRAERGS